MRLDYDVRHLPGSRRDWDQLVAAVSQAPDDTVETFYLERKRPIDLGVAEGKFPAAKAILAFANRDPEAAAPFFDGRALIVIGVDEGTIPGIRRIEEHQLVGALKPYLGDDGESPRWKAERHRVSDQNDVLIIVVDAPRSGDPIFTLRQEFGNHLRGTVFTRSSTESVQADHRAMQMLSHRLLARHEEFEIELTLGPEDIRRYNWDPAVLDPVLQAAVQHYLDQIPRGGVVWGSTPRPQLPNWTLEKRHEESRTRDEFRAELEQWADDVRKAIPDIVRDLIAINRPPAKFTVRNLRGRFLEDLEVVVHIEGPVIQHPKPFTSESVLDRLPHRPRKWGPSTEKYRDFSNYVQVPPVQARQASPNSTSFATRDRWMPSFSARTSGRGAATHSPRKTATGILYC